MEWFIAFEIPRKMKPLLRFRHRNLLISGSALIFIFAACTYISITKNRVAVIQGKDEILLRELIAQENLFCGLSPHDKGAFLVRGVRDNRTREIRKIENHAFGLQECGLPPEDIQQRLKAKFPQVNKLPTIMYELGGDNIYWLCVEKWNADNEVIISVGKKSASVGFSEKTIVIKKRQTWDLEEIISLTVE